MGEVSAIQVQNSKLLLICGFGGSIDFLSVFSQNSHAQIREGSACQEVACFHKFTGLPIPNRELRGCIILIKVLDIMINLISCLPKTRKTEMVVKYDREREGVITFPRETHKVVF